MSAPAVVLTVIAVGPEGVTLSCSNWFMRDGEPGQVTLGNVGEELTITPDSMALKVAPR